MLTSYGKIMVREFPNAKCDKCDEEFDDRRKQLGYNTCLSCGQLIAEQVKFCVAPVHKSNYVVVTRKSDLIGINTKNCQGNP